MRRQNPREEARSKRARIVVRKGLTRTCLAMVTIPVVARVRGMAVVIKKELRRTAGCSAMATAMTQACPTASAQAPKRLKHRRIWRLFRAGHLQLKKRQGEGVG